MARAMKLAGFGGATLVDKTAVSPAIHKAIATRPARRWWDIGL
jgi:hypothetical protein